MNISNLWSIPIRPLDASSGSSSSSANGSSSSTPSNQLNANSFITLLTAQLQAQDPLDPMDPNQMVDELTSMNSLQQLMAIKQDLDSLLSAAGGSPPAASGSVRAANATPNLAATPSASYHDAVVQQKIFPASSPANS